MMKLNHAANRLDAKHFETIVDMLKTRLGFYRAAANGSSDLASPAWRER